MMQLAKSTAKKTQVSGVKHFIFLRLNSWVMLWVPESPSLQKRQKTLPGKMTD
jgi:hypothetical protein